MWVNFAGCLNSKRLNPGLSMHGSKRDRISWQKVSDWRADSMCWAALYRMGKCSHVGGRGLAVQGTCS